MTNRLPLLGALLCLCPNLLLAQWSEGGTPLTFLPEHAPILSKAGPVTQLPVLDVARTVAEDNRTPGQNRFAAPVPTNVSTTNTGHWSALPDSSGRIWYCALRSTGAKGLILSFDRFVLPNGGRFYAYTPNHRKVLGAYTEKSCLPSGQFLVGILPGDEVRLEYYEPKGAKPAEIHINRIDYVYQQGGVPEDFGDGAACNINVNCTQGNAWQTEKKGVARIMMQFSNGTGWCTGSLVANTSGTPEPYFLTAHHCQLIGLNPNFNLWRFDFFYEAPGCTNPATEPSFRSVLGCQRLSWRQETDFLFLKLNPLPDNLGVYFNGWNRNTATTHPSGVFIHHPSGDIKKISIDPKQIGVHGLQVNWGGIFGVSAPNSHWKVDPDEGIFRQGSSGCPLFDPNKRVIGQLHGGILPTGTSCNVTDTYFGRFDLSFVGNTPEVRLRDWLDPNNTGNLTQNGYAQPMITQFDLSGNIKTHWGEPMPKVRVRLMAGTTIRDSVLTDSVGNYTFKKVLAGGNYSIAPVSDTVVLNGVTTLDLALVSKHILGLESFNSPWKMLAADANKSNTITTFDVVEVRKAILGIYEKLPNTDPWRFFPTNSTLPDPANPFATGTTLRNTIEIANLQANQTGLDFWGVKIGDVNNSAR